MKDHFFVELSRLTGRVTCSTAAEATLAKCFDV